MVLEGYLSRLLVDRFGRYVKGLDADNLRLSAWKGEVFLKNLRLVPEALSEGLDLPVDVKWGHVGLFHLSVPWSTLGSKPVCVTLEDVYILVSPLDTWSMDDMERQRRARYQKFRRVESRLRKHLERKALLAEGVSKADGGAGGKGMWARMFAKVLDNLQVTVKNIHVRYEDILSLDEGGGDVDGGTSIPRPLSAGVTLRKLVAQTVDEHWMPTYVQEAGAGDSEGDGFVHKLVTVDSLAVYCDEPHPPAAASKASSQSLSSLINGNSEADTKTDGACSSSGSFLAAGLSDEELEGMFKMSLTSGEDKHSYVVIPASPSLRLSVQRGGDGGGGARCKAQAFFNDVGVLLNNSQIANINKMRSTLRDLERWEALYRHRPKHGVKEGPKAWWVFLVKSVSRPGKTNKRKKLGWLDVARLLALRKAYVRLYTARARHQATPEDYREFTRLDEQLTANEIVAFRLKAMAELEEEEELSPTVPGPQQPQPRQTWTEWLLRRGGSASASSPSVPDGAGGTSEDTGKSSSSGVAVAAAQGEDAAAREEFLRIFAPEAEGADASADRGDGGDVIGGGDRVLWDVKACLNEGALTLVNAGRPCLRIIFDLKAELKKKKADWRLELGLGSLQVFGLGGKGARATTLLTRRTWRPHEVASHDGDMIQIGDFQVWKSGGVVIEFRGNDTAPASAVADHGNPSEPSPRTPVPSRPSYPRNGADSRVVDDSASTLGGGRESVVTIKLVLAPHQVLHDRACVEQVTSMLATRDMRLLTSAAQSKISRLQRATRSSFLHALGSSQRFEVTADIHAPLLILPENPKEHSRSSLLVLDLDHIAFRRDDLMGGGRVSTGEGVIAHSAASGQSAKEAKGVREQGMLGSEFLGANRSGLMSVDNWRLDVSGVQAVVADASSFFGERSAAQGPSVDAPPADTAIVEGFDLHVKIRTTTDRSTDGLVGLGLEASLPRLSFNLRNSAYLLLSRLLKKELSGSSETDVMETAASPSGTTLAPLVYGNASTNGDASNIPVQVGGASPGNDGHLISGARAEQEERKATLVRDRGIKTVLSLDLDPVTEIPGEGPGESQEEEWDVVGRPLGGGKARGPRRSTGSRRSSRGRTGSGSTIVQSSEVEGLCGEGDEATASGGEHDAPMEEKDAEEEDDCYDEISGGLAVEVRVSAPVICVLLVHDEDASSDCDGDGVRSRSGFPEAIPRSGTGFSPGGTAGNGVIGPAMRKMETEEGQLKVDTAGEEVSGKGGGDGSVDGALVLLEISGLRVEYRDMLGGGHAGRGSGGGGGGEGIVRGGGSTERAENDSSLLREDVGEPAVARLDHDFCLTAASFAVKDMYQRVGNEFSYLLSSSDPLSTLPMSEMSRVGSASAWVPPEALQGGSDVSHTGDVAIRITRALSRRGENDGGVVASRSTVIALGGVWANWNPETVAALSIFAYGMYGHREKSADDAAGDKINPGARVGSLSETSGELERGMPGDGGSDESAVDCGPLMPKVARVEGESIGTPGGIVVVEIKRVSLWLNKEVHGRRLLLLEAGYSTVEISKVFYTEGSVTSYSIGLSAALLTDLGTKKSLWRTLVSPRQGDHLPRQEIRLSILQDSRKTEFPLQLNLELQSCAVNYLNQTWLEAFDYVLNGVLGDGPWCPWLLVPQTKDGSGADTTARAPAATPHAVVKRRMHIVATDAEVKLPADHASEGGVALDIKRLTAGTSYELRRMGDAPQAEQPQLCQIWSVELDGVDILSSGHPKPGTNAVASTTVPAVAARVGSSLLRENALSGGVNIEAWWPVVHEEGGPGIDGLRSNYVIIGRAPSLDLTLDEHDFSLLWQVLGGNIAGAAPEAADPAYAVPASVILGSAGVEARAGVRSRRQVVVFPYEHTPRVATTFDITFQIPDFGLVAYRDENAMGPCFNGDVDSAGASVVPGAGALREIGRARSRLLTWRMLRFSDLRSTNEVTAKDPLVTESLLLGDGHRELFGPAPKIPISFHGGPHRATVPSKAATGNAEPGGASSSLGPNVEGSSVTRGQGKDDVQSPEIPASSFRWKMKSWSDGGRTHSLAVSGSGILLSRRGWSLWRLWSTSNGGRGSSSSSGGGGGGGGFPSRGQQQQSDVSEKPENESHAVGGRCDAGDRARSSGAFDVYSDEAAADDSASELAFAMDVQLSGTCLSFEPWEYESDGLGLGKEAGDGILDQEGSAVVVRTDLAMRMTTAVFLEGHWARGFGAGELLQEYGGVIPLPTAAEMRRDPEDPRETSMTCLKIGKVEGFSRPAGGAPLSSSTSRTRQRQGDEATGTTEAEWKAEWGRNHKFGVPSETPWRTLIEPAAGTVMHSFAPPRLKRRAQISDSEEQGSLARCGLRRILIEDFSLVRAVVRPSDADVVARSLAMPEVGEGNLDSKSSGTAASSCSGRAESSSPTSSADVSVRASGAGWIIRFEDDSGRHFVPPPGSTSASSSARDGRYAPESRDVNECFPRAPGHSPSRRCSFTTDGDPPWQQVIDRSTCPLGISVASPAVGGGLQDPRGILPRNSRRHQRCRFPRQPVVEASVGEWGFRYSRDSWGAVERGDVEGGNGDLIETAMLSMSAVSVVDLLQRQPCHAAFRELLVIAPSGVSRPQESCGGRQPAVSQASLPPAGDNSDWLRDRLKEGHGRSGGEDESIGAREGCVPLLAASSPTATSGESPPSVLLHFRRVLSGSTRMEGSASSTSAGGGGTQAPAESSREKGEASTAPIGGMDGSKRMSGAGAAVSASGGDDELLLMPAAAEAPAEGTSGAALRVTVSVELGDPVKANWNPRTMVALWSLRAALSAAAVKGDMGEDAAREREAEVTRGEDPVSVGAGAVEGTRAVGASTTPSRSCSTEIGVIAREGIEVMLNKEKEGRQLMAMQAAALDLIVESSRRSRATDATVVWKGRLDDFSANDPRGSNVLYSTLVGSHSPIPPTSAGADGEPSSRSSPAPPVHLTFHYLKKNCSGAGSAAAVGSPGDDYLSSFSFPREKSVLSLRFSALEVVYFQPLWLEAIDYLWEGVLGSAVWGGAVDAGSANYSSDEGKGEANADENVASTFRRSEAHTEGGRRSASEIHVTLSSPTIVLPGSPKDPRHLSLRPRHLRFSSWTGGPDDRDSPPSMENCSPDGPVARHMFVDAPGTEISLGYCGQAGSASQQHLFASVDPGEESHQPSARFPSAEVDGSVCRGQGSESDGGVQESGTVRWEPILKDPVNVEVSVTSMSPAEKGDVRVEGGAGFQGSEGGTSSLNRRRDGVSVPEGEILNERGTRGVTDAGGASIARGKAIGERTMSVSVELTELSLALAPEARAALTDSVGKNILAAGFHGDVSEIFPWTRARGEQLPSSQEEEDGFGLREDCAIGCAVCNVSFDELVARHRCAWCRGAVCRGCMQTPVRTAVDVGSAYHESTNRTSDAEGDDALSVLVCDACAARSFPETSVNAGGKIRFQFGDDGPATAMEVALDIPKIRVDFQPSGEAFPFPKEGKEGNDCSESISVDGEGFELTYKRRANRRGGLESSLRSVTVSDPDPGIAFHRPLAPGSAPLPLSGDACPPQVALSYYFSPKNESAIQIMVNHLEAVVVSSTIRKLKALAEPASSSTPPKQQREERANMPGLQGTQAKSGAALEGMHDLATLQLASDGGLEGKPKTPLTVRGTFLNPLVMLPQDERDGDCSALFLQGLVMVHYVRSPRYEKAYFESNNRGADGGGTERVAAEARDIALEIIRLESQIGRMYGGSGRPQENGGAFASLGGRGQGTGAFEPVTLSLHYSEVETSLHPIVKDLKCQMEDVSCQLTYQDMALFHKVLSGWFAGLSAADKTDSDTSRAKANEINSGGAVSAGRGVPTEARQPFVGQEGQGFTSIDDGLSESADDEGEGIEPLLPPKQDDNHRFYKVVFETKQLGLILFKQDGVAIVDEVSAYHGIGGRSAGPFPGDEVVAVAGEPTSRMTYQGVVDRIRSSPRPITLEFRRALFESWWGREYALDLSSWDGNNLDGIFLVGGGAGDQAVVGSTATYRPKRRPGTPAGVPPLRPRRGALVVAINSNPVSHLKLSAVKRILDEISETQSSAAEEGQGRRGDGGRGERPPAAAATSVKPSAYLLGTPSPRGSRTGNSKSATLSRMFREQLHGRPQQQQQQQVAYTSSDKGGGNSSSSKRRRKIRLLLREIEVHAWPPNWRHEVQCTRVRVTVIDDREGRDMPLLRAEVGGLDMTHEIGPGMARRRAETRSTLHRSRGKMRSTSGRASVEEDTLYADLATPVSRTAASCEAQVEYYHGTGGRWEPLLERVVAQGDREIVSQRLDGRGGREESTTKSIVRLSCFEEDVKINVTHAALDVILRAMRDWRACRNVDDGGQESSSAPQRYSPFVLQNRTGLPLEFWAHQDRVDSVSRFSKKGIVVDGTADKPFGPSVEARRSRRHASWMVSLRLLPNDGSDAEDGNGQRFLNLPLKETGRSVLQCMLAMESVGGEEGGARQLQRCDAVWEVALENGRHKVTLRSALQIVNMCGSWLEVRCSTEAFAAARDKASRREQAVGTVAPGARLPLPLRWSRVEDIRLRPLPKNGREDASPINPKSVPKNVPSVSSLGLGEDGVATVYDFSDCSVLLPVARAGEKELGLTMSVIPWVACYSLGCAGGDTTTTSAHKPLFLFMEGVDRHAQDGATVPGDGPLTSLHSRRPSANTRRRFLDRSTSDPAPASAKQKNSDGDSLVSYTGSAAIARSSALALRPLEVVVYASLSFRNLLPVAVGWRAVGARDNPDARLAEGWLGPGEGVQVLEANTMAVKPSFSFKVAGFDWTSPRQVSVKEITRRHHASPGVSQSSRDLGHDAGRGSGASGRFDEEDNQEMRHRPGIGLENIPCRNLANQILYLSAEATSPRMNSVHVTIFTGFWVRNLSGLPLTLGEPVPTRLSSLERQEERLAEQSTWRRSPSPPPNRSPWDVFLSAAQSNQHGITEEVFELRLAGSGGGGKGTDEYATRWCTAQGNPRSPYYQIRLPSELWRWEGDWTIDVSGAVAPDAPGTDGGGWESCERKLRGGQYGNGSFAPSRAFKLSEPVWRRRWLRRRVPSISTLHRNASQSALKPAAEDSAAPKSEPVALSEGSDLPAASVVTKEPFREGTSVIYEPASAIRNKGLFPQEGSRVPGVATDGRADGAALCIRVDDSAWSRPLNISVQGAGGPFHVPGGRWPDLKRPSYPAPQAEVMRNPNKYRRQERRYDPGSTGGAGGVWGEGDVGVYELAYDVRIAPVPWNRTRVITVTSRYTVMNRCDCVLVVKQYGSNVTMELDPGESRPLHWADGSLEANLSVSVIPRAEDDSEAAPPMDWSGPVGLGNIGTFPICIRPKPGGAALPADSPTKVESSRGSSPSRRGATGSLSPLSINPREAVSEPMPMVGSNRILGVEVNIGRHSDDLDRASDATDDAGAGQGFRSSAVQVIFQEEAWGTGDRFPTYRLENYTSSRMFYGQVAVPGPGDALPSGRSCLFGWDQPCPAEERAQGVLNLSLVLAPEPLSSPEGKRLAKTLNIRKLGEKVVLSTARGRVEVVVEPDGPSKVVRMFAAKRKLVSILSPPRALSVGTQRSVSQRSLAGAENSTIGRTKSPLIPGGSRRDVFGVALPAPSARGMQRSSSSIPVVEHGGPAMNTTSLDPPRSSSSRTGFSGEGGASAPSPVQGAGGDSAERVSLRELHVFCRAVRVSIVDGDRGEMVLGSLEGTSLSVAATEREVEVKSNIGSLQIDSHMPGTSFPVVLQPVRPGGLERSDSAKCIRFALVAAPHIKNVTYIKLASLKVDEFDLRLDEGMVRWAQGLADRVLWTLVADRRADEISTWPLPNEAFCSPQASRLRGDATGGETGGRSSRGRQNAVGSHSAPFTSRYVYLEVLQVSSVKVRLSLQRAKDSFETVYVGVKPGQMLLDLMMRMDSAHIKLKSLIVHNATTTRSRLMLTTREHYERELKQQAFLMLGSLEAFGNPVGLLRGMGQGVQDFVKEPVLGLLKSVEDLAPEELMAGMARGAGSLLKHSVGGVANSVSLITGTVSQNLSTLAMDKEYKLKRAMRKEARGDNKDLLVGIGSAGGSLARGLTDGVSGLIRNPMKGAESGGLTGFAKGVGTGVLGLVVKPVVGVTDAATDVLQGVRSATESIARIGNPSPSSSAPFSPGASLLHRQHGAQPHFVGDGSPFLSGESTAGIGREFGGEGGAGSGVGLGQVRPRRVLYGPERALRSYAIEDARAAAMLRATCHKDEEYLAHLEMIQLASKPSDRSRHRVVLLTQSLVLMLRIPFGEVELEQRLDGIQVVEKTVAGVLLHLFPAFSPRMRKQGSSGFPGLPPPPSQQNWRSIERSQTKGIACRDEETKRRLYDMIDAAVKNVTLLP